MRKQIFGFVAPLALMASPSPLLAQEEAPSEAEMHEMFAGIGALFATEQLTAEQEARLPAAEKVIARMMPEGIMQELMGSMFDGLLGPMMAMIGPDPSETLNDNLGELAHLSDLDGAEKAEAATILDPNWQQRQELQFSQIKELMAEVMLGMEPGMRKAMSELYAINFDADELLEIDAFFATETGANFARKSFTMASDPRIMSASMEAMPAMMASLGDLDKRMEQAAADLPSPRSFDDLSVQDQVRLSELTEKSTDEIRESMESASAADSF